MFEDDEICEEKWVGWRDPQNAEIYGSGSGPFLVTRVKEEECIPTCSCGGRGGSLFNGGHSPRCEIRAKKVVGTFVTVGMNGRHRSFSEDLFETVPEPWRK